MAALAALGAMLPACSVLFDGSRFSGGSEPGADAGPPDAEALDAEVPMHCDGAVACPSGSYCGTDEFGESVCLPCDSDGDGFVAEVPDSCDDGGRSFDCDDRDPTVFPGALPICGNSVAESCGAMLPVGSDMRIDEMGFFPVQSVSWAPADAVPARLRVFVQEVPGAPEDVEALLFFQINDAQRTPQVARASLGHAPTVAADSIERYVSLGMLLGELWYDAQRDSDGRVRFAMIGIAGTDLLGAQHILFDGTTVTPSAMVLHSTIDPASGLSFEIVSHPALVVSGLDAYFGVPGAWTGVGVSKPEIRTLGTQNIHNDLAGHDNFPGSMWGAVSDGQHAAFHGSSRLRGESLRVWNGSLNSDVPDELAVFESGFNLTTRPAVVTLPAVGTEPPRFVVLAPGGGSISVYSSQCSRDVPLSECVLESAPRIVPVGVDAEPLLSAVPIGPTSIGAVMRRVGSGGDDGLALLLYEHDAEVGSDPMTFPLPSPGRGRILDVDLDAQFREDRSGAGTLTLVYALARHMDGMLPTVHVGAVRACVGYGMP